MIPVLKGRMLAYALILIWYYTFITIYSIILGFLDILVSTVMVTVISYAWLLHSASKYGALFTLDYKDLCINIFVYSFISFYIAMTTLFFSGKPDFIRFALLMSPMMVWVPIWTDFYLQRLKGKV